MALKLPSYTLPEIYRGPTDWYVSYSYLSPYTGKYKRFKESYGLNKKDHIPLREEIAIEIVDVITSQLKKGYNPFLKQIAAESADIQPKQEDVVVPEKASTYVPDRRGNDWLKVPTRKRQEFVIGAWVESDNGLSSCPQVIYTT